MDWSLGALLGASWGRLGALVGASWWPLGGLLSHLGAIVHVEAIWSRLGVAGEGSGERGKTIEKARVLEA